MISTTENIASLSTKKQTENKTNKCHQEREMRKTQFVEVILNYEKEQFVRITVTKN